MTSNNKENIPMNWIDDFRAQTGVVIEEPFWRCLAEAIACVESARGTSAILDGGGLNEIGYKAVPGKPACRRATREADSGGRLQPQELDFRLFRDRAEQARALLWLLRSSSYYESARLLFILAFYAAYAPGRDEGARAVIKVFNEIARTGIHEGVRPLALTDAGGLDTAARALNHESARRAVRLFTELTM
jgi:hypothetical protein